MCHWNVRGSPDASHGLTGIETPVKKTFPSRGSCMYVCVCAHTCVWVCVHACACVHTRWCRTACKVHKMHLKNVSASIIWTSWAFREVFCTRFKEVPGTKNVISLPLSSKAVYKLNAFSKSQLWPEIFFFGGAQIGVRGGWLNYSKSVAQSLYRQRSWKQSAFLCFWWRALNSRIKSTDLVARKRLDESSIISRLI